MGRFHERVSRGICGMCGARPLNGERRQRADGHPGAPYRTCRECRKRMRTYAFSLGAEKRAERAEYSRAYRLQKELDRLKVENELRAQRGEPLRELPGVERELEAARKVARARQETKLKNLDRRLKELDRQRQELRDQRSEIARKLEAELEA